ncbi:GAF domain-containing protein [Xanthomonas arboricola pv. pruni]|nr:histidine kinase [Xanthomonas arboricola pv. juglandis]QEX77133.1 GAF domain-containing protein [Xanthomonas arboricola pv. pruni]RST71929.1 GAF domain-containing protein [Xanthomonas arboricola pv. pruni]RST77794.1 GAF domain-containing protein [Xanthomonas arboricola pv. pruni]
MAYSMKQMPPADEASRQQVLDGYRIVDSLPEDTYQDVVQVAASLCNTPIALMSLVDRDRQWFKAQLGLGMQQTDRSQAVCDHAIRSPEQLMEVRDLTQDSRFADVSVVTGETGARFYAGMPLVTSDGVALGTVCVLDTEPRTLTDIQRTGLQALARVTMRLLDERKRELQLEREAILQPVAPVAAPAAADTGYYLVILEVQELAALAEKQSERLLGRALQQLDQALAAQAQANGDSVDRVTDSAEFIAVLRDPNAEQKLQRLRDIAQQQHAHGLTVLIGQAQATRGDEPIGQVFLRAEVALSAEKDRYRQSLARDGLSA